MQEEQRIDVYRDVRDMLASDISFEYIVKEVPDKYPNRTHVLRMLRGLEWQHKECPKGFFFALTALLDDKHAPSLDGNILFDWAQRGTKTLTDVPDHLITKIPSIDCTTDETLAFLKQLTSHYATQHYVSGPPWIGSYDYFHEIAASLLALERKRPVCCIAFWYQDEGAITERLCPHFIEDNVMSELREVMRSGYEDMVRKAGKELPEWRARFESQWTTCVQYNLPPFEYGGNGTFGCFQCVDPSWFALNVGQLAMATLLQHGEIALPFSICTVEHDSTPVPVARIPK